MKNLFARLMLVLLLLFVCSHVSFGQQNFQDVVYLKNGSIIRGTIIEQVPNKSIKIQTTDRNVFVYQIEEIEKLTKEELTNNNNSSTPNTNTNANLPIFKNANKALSGYSGRFDFGYGLQSNTAASFGSFNFVNGYRFNQYIYWGIGLGARYVFDSKTVILPFSTNLRVHFVEGKISPFLDLSGGYAGGIIGGDLKGVGAFYAPAIGISFMANPQSKSSINVSLAYHVQKINDYSSYSSSYTYTLIQSTFNNTMLNIGFSF